MRKKQGVLTDGLRVGVCYYPEQWEKTFWRDDLTRMLKNGISCVRIGEFAWTILEPEEGRFSFGFFDAFLDLAEELGISVIFCTPTAIPPVWMSEKYPDILNCRKDGTLYRHGMRRHYNYNSKTLHSLAEEAIEKIAEHYAKRKCIIGWQIDNEFNCEISEYYSKSDDLAFRDYLKKKYNNLTELNRAWGTRFWNQVYTEWEQVHVPLTTINNSTNPHQQLDFIFFVSESTIAYCRMQSDILRKYIKEGDFITTNGGFANVDNHRMADECLDIFMYDCYPGSAYFLDRPSYDSDTWKDRKWSMNLANIRSICPHFGIMEQQSGNGGWNAETALLTPALKKGQLGLWAMNSVAQGADYVSFFRWRTAAYGTEMYYRGILDPDNRDNERLREINQFAKRLQNISFLAGSDYIAECAIIRDYANMFDARVDKRHSMLLEASECALYRTAQLTHTPIDFLYITENTEKKDLQRYKVLFCPHKEIITEKEKRLLEIYVYEGGILIIGARTGQKNVYGHNIMAPMPGGLAELTGTTVSEYTMAFPDEEKICMEWKGKRLDIGNFYDILECENKDVKILARYCNGTYRDEPALIETNQGKGKIIHYGGVFTEDISREILSYCNVMTPYKNIVELPEMCELAVKRKDGIQYFFVLNFSDQNQKIFLNEVVTDVETGETSKGEMNILPYEVKIFEDNDGMARRHEVF